MASKTVVPDTAIRGEYWLRRYGSGATPFFSICIPQHNRTSFLIEGLRVLASQTFENWEVCISDDCSTDGREAEVLTELESLRLPYVYCRQSRNGKYDVNLRAAILLASGTYCILMGNDDCFAGSNALALLEREMKRHSNIGVVITNYDSFDGSRRYHRVAQTGIAGSGPAIAVDRFRNFSFVSGVVLRTDRAKVHATDKWDSSEMYQMYIGCRILAEGYSLLEDARCMVRMGIVVPGEQVDSYKARPRLNPCPIIERKIPLVQLGSLVYDAILPYAGVDLDRLCTRIFTQILLFTFPFWIFEYRRIQCWRYAFGICLGMRPRNLLQGIKIPTWRYGFLSLLYTFITIAGLVCPIRLFDRHKDNLYKFAKGIRRE